jgi:outer membrane protein assembly factor BamB
MRAMKEHISHERLRELLDYNPEKGVFTWNETISPRARAGDPAGYLTKEGYWRITIEGCVYFAGPSRYFGCRGDIQRDMLCI